MITVLGPAHDTDSDHVPYQVEQGRRGCDYDRVEIMELATNSSRGQYCGDQPPEAPVSTRGGMVVRCRCYEMSRTLSLCLLFFQACHGRHSDQAGLQADLGETRVRGQSDHHGGDQVRDMSYVTCHMGIRVIDKNFEVNDSKQSFSNFTPLIKILSHLISSVSNVTVV